MESFATLKIQADAAWQELATKPRIAVGIATCANAAGALQTLEALRAEVARCGVDCTVGITGCFGLCHEEPLVDIYRPGWPRITYGKVSPERAAELVADVVVAGNVRTDLAVACWEKGFEVGGTAIPYILDLPFFRLQERYLLQRCGVIDPENIEHYVANGGYSALDKALSVLGPDGVLEEVNKSGLAGRGGAAFPAGRKWSFCREAAGEPKYIICNADEGDPGTFVDRALMEGDPHLVIEGILLCAYAIGATGGYIYIRGEYPLAIQRIATAIQQAEERGLLGDRILGSDFSFHLDIVRGAGAFVCGEETALIASIEGRRGHPAVRPPYPAQSGVWGKPTNVNNVETLANVPLIVERGGDWYAGIGTQGSKGTKLFSISGNLLRTGIIEVPFGISLRAVIEQIGGGVPAGHRLKAVQPGGAMSGVIPEHGADLPVDFGAFAQAGSALGSGGLVALDERACMVDLARFLMQFAYEESCGQCTLGRLGARQMLDILDDIAQGRGQPGDIDLLVELGEVMTAGCFCALCGGAPAPVLSTIRHYRDEYEAHIKENRCPTQACEALASGQKG